MGTFSSLNVGVSALHAQRRAIDVAGQNIANVNTAGYSRQRADMVADSGPIVPALFSRYEGTGQGVRSVDVTRIRDHFLESRSHRENATRAYLGQLQTTMARVELAYAEPSETGLAAQLADFWAGWDDVGLNPTDPAARAQLLERAGTLTASFGQLTASLDSLAGASVEQIQATVQDVNGVADRIADLNNTIRTAAASGLSVNDLMDQRDLLVQDLATQVGATVRPNEDGSLDVYVGGMALVRSSAVEHLAVEVTGSPSVVAVVWADDGLQAAVGGRARGHLETVNDVLPGQRAELAAVAQRLIDDVNAIHATGFDLAGAPGGPFFEMGPGGIQLAAAVAGDPARVAASASPTAGSTDGSVAQLLATQTGPDGDYRELVVRLGVSAQAINRRVEVHGAVVEQLDAERESVAGVNLDEEMTSLVAFQHAYSAAAQYIATVDEMLHTLLTMVA